MIHQGFIKFEKTNKLAKGMLAEMNTGHFVVITGVTPETVSVKSIIKGKSNFNHFATKMAGTIMKPFRVTVHIPAINFTIPEEHIYRDLVQSVLSKKIREGQEV